MKLQKVELNGFKSFADKTQFAFDDGITAIVGPNGCGKSNVVDAVKWVLGDQSPKSLRSGQMTDVIFSGTSSRKPASMAQVSLFFEDVALGQDKPDCLQITRRLYRSGDSEYLMNGKPCRLRDIKEFFMDTGVGVRAYSIIEQGQIDQLLHASKVDRRTIFEEAAGISKFKAHKKEAIRKLERTEQNLIRLADIVSEVQKQLRSVKLQAGKAKNYLQYAERLKELKVKFSLAEYDRLLSDQKVRTESLNDVQGRFSTVAAEVGSCDAAVSELGNKIIETENDINRWDNALISATGKIEQQYERIDMLSARIKELGERKSAAAEQINKMRTRKSDLEKELEGSKESLEKSRMLYEQKLEEIKTVESELNEIKTQCSSLEAQLEDEKSGVIDSVRRTAQLHNEIKSISTYRNNLTGQVDRLNDKAKAAEQKLQEMLTEKAQHNARLEDIRSLIGELNETLEEKRSKAQAIDEQAAVLGEELADIKDQRTALRSEYNVLDSMENEKKGISPSVRNILEQRAGQSSNIRGIVADIIRADIEYAPAVEAALEGLTDALVVNSARDLLEDRELMDNLDSRVKVICADQGAPFTDSLDTGKFPQIKARLAELVSFDSGCAPLAWEMLGKVLLVDSIESAIEINRDIPAGYKFVTLEGRYFDGKNILSIGPMAKNAGLISRRSTLDDLKRRIDGLSARASELEENLEDKNRENERLRSLCQNLRTSIYEANTERVDSESHLRSVEQNIKRLAEEQPVIAGEIDMLEKEISESVQKEYESKNKLEEEETVKQQRNENIKAIEEKLAVHREGLNDKSSQLTELRVSLGQVSEQQNSLRQNITSLQSQLHHASVAMDSARHELGASTEMLKETNTNILAAQTRVSDLFCEKESAQKQSKALHKHVEQMIERRKETQERLNKARRQQAEIENEINELKLQLNEIHVKIDSLTTRVAEELKINIAEAYENFQQDDTDFQQVREEISQLNTKIERLGNVNIDAIDQQDDLEEREKFLTGQVDDLNKSKHQLEQLINRINIESREKFATTFEQVRENFQLLFRKLFGGGKADILLEEPDDILESGIEIMARPPGKETRSISLLSGGEKTMTAIALMFAVFKSKPSPFCFLDEVDAALDEANNERFNLIVQEFQEDSQFVIITHSKRTMSIADVLFGVTMQTRGISKKISVRFDSAEIETDEEAA